MKKIFVELGLAFAACLTLSGVAYAQSEHHVGSWEWMGDTVGRVDGPDEGRARLDCGSNDYITKIHFRRYRGARDADYYTFAAECRTKGYLDYEGYTYQRPDPISQHTITCGNNRPIRGIAMWRYRKINGDYDTYIFSPKCDQPADPTAGPYRQFVGSTRGDAERFTTAECSRSNQRIMTSFEAQRFRESRRDYDTYRVAIGCR